MTSRGKSSESIRAQSSSSATIRSHEGDTCEPLFAENFSLTKPTGAERVSVLCADSDVQTSKMAAPMLTNDQIQQLLKQNELLIKQQSKTMSSFMNYSFKAPSDQSDWIDDMSDTDTSHGFDETSVEILRMPQNQVH